MKKPALFSLVSLTFLGFWAGCQTAPGPYAPQETTKYVIENTDKFILMDKATLHSVTCTGLQPSATADGKLEVVALVKNRENRRIQVQISCVFKDEQKVSTGDETPWQSLILGENATEAVRFTAMNTLAKEYTIRVRQVR